MDDEPTIPLDPARPSELAPTAPDDRTKGVPAPVKAPASDEPEELQRHLPQYRVRELVGRGGMGNVLKVDDPKLARTVALKTMKLGPEATEEQRGRFVREATVLARLAHPNIVPIYDLGADDQGRPFYTMKLVKGRTLKEILKDIRDGEPDAAQQNSLDRLLGIFRKVCDAIAFAHSKSVLHRDLKPENIMVGEFGEVLVMDWGLAKLLHGDKEAWSGGAVSQSMIEQSRVSLGRSPVGATHDGAIMGTPQYMSPEQAEGKTAELDERSDIFSLGAILYSILTLHPPVEGKTVSEVLKKISSGQIAPPSTFGAKSTGEGTLSTKGEVLDARVFRPLPHCPGGRVPTALSAVTMKALSVDKARRYQAVNEFSAEVEAWQGGFATSAEKAGLTRQLALLVKRHQGIFSTAFAAWLIITVLAIWFVIHLRASERLASAQRDRAAQEKARAEKNLDDLRKTAPTFYEQARLLTDGGKLPEALDKIAIALTLNPQEARFHAQRGHILQSLERFAEAAEAYAAAVRLNPRDESAATNLELSHTLAEAKARDGTLTITTRMKWRDALAQQGRHAEAILAGRGLAADVKKMLPSWQAKLEAWLGKNAPRLKFTTNGLLYDLDLSNFSLTDLSPLRGMPVGALMINGNPHIKDLGPLADSPLSTFYANGVTDLVDLSPLKGKRLRVLQLSKTSVRDLGPLAGMKTLVELRITAAPISDLTPLREARLKILSVYESEVRSLEPLRGQPLEELDLNNVSISSLEPVGDAPLQRLDITRSGHLDLSALRTRHLRALFAHGTTLDHLEVLAEMTDLEIINLPKNMTDPTILRKLPHLRKIAVVSVAGEEQDMIDADVFWREYDAKQAAGKK